MLGCMAAGLPATRARSGCARRCPVRAGAGRQPRSLARRSALASVWPRSSKAPGTPLPDSSPPAATPFTRCSRSWECTASACLTRSSQAYPWASPSEPYGCRWSPKPAPSAMRKPCGAASSGCTGNPRLTFFGRFLLASKGRGFSRAVEVRKRSKVSSHPERNGSKRPYRTPKKRYAAIGTHRLALRARGDTSPWTSHC